MRSILSNTSNSAQGGGRAQPDVCQPWLAAQIEPVKGERSEFILTLDGSGRIIPSCKQRQCFIVSYQPTGRRLSWLQVLHVLQVRHVPVLTIKGVVSILGSIAQRVQVVRVGVGEIANVKLGGWGCYPQHCEVGTYLLNVPRAPINESSLTQGAFIAT